MCAADVCSDMTRQVAGRVSYAYAAGDAASSLQALLPVPFGSILSQRPSVGKKSGTSSGDPCRAWGESSAGDTA